MLVGTDLQVCPINGDFNHWGVEKMRKVSFLFLLVGLLLSLGAVNFCSAQWQRFGPEVRRWEIDVENGQFSPVDRGRDFPHDRFERARNHRVAISLPKGRVLKPEQVSINSGIIKDDFLVNDDTISGSLWSCPVVAMDALGNFVICWSGCRNNDCGIYAQRYSNSGDALGANFRVSDRGGSLPSIAMDAAGDFVICWKGCRPGDLGDIYAQRYSSSGDTLGANFRVNDDVGVSYQSFPSIAMDADGDFVICWNTHPLGWNGSPSAVLGKSQGVMDPYVNVYAQRYSSSGDTLGTNFRVNDVETGKQWFSSIAMDADGDFVICWEDSRNGGKEHIYAQRYSSSGDTLGSNFRVNDDDVETGYKWYPWMAMDADGNFVVCWQDGRNGDWDIYAQRYNSLGDTLGANFRVTDDVDSSSQYWPRMAMDGDGDFVICWQDDRNGDQDIYAQRYSSSGDTLGTNYLVNQRPDVANPDQEYPSVALTNARITFTWQDARRSKGWDIYAKVVTWDWDKVDEPGDDDLGLPKDFTLFQNYPNPFNSATLIRYQLSAVGRPRSAVTLKVYNILGEEVRTLVNEEQDPRNYVVVWDGKDSQGKEVASGIYLCRLRCGSLSQIRKMVLLR